MERRNFLKTGAAAAGAAALTGGEVMAQKKNNFKLKYAPHFGMFKHHAGDDMMDQLQFMADVGFTAIEDNGMGGRSVDDQKKIARKMEQLDMTMGVFVSNANFSKKTFVHKENRDALVAQMKQMVEVAKRVNAKWTTVVPDAYDPNMEWEYQTANVIENLKYCAEVFEPHGVVMVLESLNPWKDHPGLFLSKIPQAYMICKAVGSPSCKILNDLYHQQITEGNLIPNIDKAWDETPYFQVGDNPGRKEPTTGEINYKNVFKHIHSKGYTGLIGMEHGISKPGKAGEAALLNAYIEVDSF